MKISPDGRNNNGAAYTFYKLVTLPFTPKYRNPICLAGIIAIKEGAATRHPLPFFLIPGYCGWVFQINGLFLFFFFNR
jgi:hypothetical protein